MRFKMRSLTALCLVFILVFSGCSAGKGKVTPEQKRLFTFGAVLATRDGTGLDTLSGMLGIYKNDYVEGLKESWDCVDHDSSIESLEWLKAEGHRKSLDEEYYGYDEYLAIASGKQLTNEEELDLLAEEMDAYDAAMSALIDEYGYTEEELLAITTTGAWDYDRTVTLARWCYGLEYISEEEMFQYINWAVEQGTKDYGSWREYFAAAMLGRSFFAPEVDFMEENQEVADALLKDEKSPYNQYAFKGDTVKA